MIPARLWREKMPHGLGADKPALNRLLERSSFLFTLADAFHEPIYALFHMSKAVENLHLFIAEGSQVLDEFLDNLLSAIHSENALLSDAYPTLRRRTSSHLGSERRFEQARAIDGNTKQRLSASRI